MDVRVGLWRKLSAEELMFLNCVLEKTLESPLDCKEIQPVHHKGDHSWVFIGRKDVEAETPILWPPDVKSWLIEKTLMLGKIEGCPQSLPASESFPMSQLFAWGGQSTRVSALASFLPKKSQGWLPSWWTGWISLQSKGLSRVFSNTTVQKHQFVSA